MDMEPIYANGRKRHRAWRAFCGRQRKLGALAHPATGGDAGLIHNWGNDEARAVVARGWARWRAYQAASDAVYRRLIHP